MAPLYLCFCTRSSLAWKDLLGPDLHQHSQAPTPCALPVEPQHRCPFVAPSFALGSVCLSALSVAGTTLCRQELSLTQLHPQHRAALTAEVERGLGMRVEREGQVGGWCPARERQHKVFSGHTCYTQWIWSLKANAALTDWLDSSSLASLASLTEGLLEHS